MSLTEDLVIDSRNRVRNADGNVAVVLHNTYGSCWSSDAETLADIEALLFDKNLVLAILRGDKESAQRIAESLVKSLDNRVWVSPYAADFEVYWVEPHRRFFISCYDGLESVVYHDSIEWIEADMQN